MTKKLIGALALAGSLMLVAPAGTAWAVSNKSPTGHYYKAGEFCPKADVGKTITDPYGRLKCELKSGQSRPHWKRVG